MLIFWHAIHKIVATKCMALCSLRESRVFSVVYHGVVIQLHKTTVQCFALLSAELHKNLNLCNLLHRIILIEVIQDCAN